MENQHQKIRGYRDLTQDEIDLINEAKELEAQCLSLAYRIFKHIAKQELGGAEERRQSLNAQANRWAHIGRTDIETGFMALTRAVAQPQSK